MHGGKVELDICVDGIDDVESKGEAPLPLANADARPSGESWQLFSKVRHRTVGL